MDLFSSKFYYSYNEICSQWQNDFYEAVYDI